MFVVLMVRDGHSKILGKQQTRSTWPKGRCFTTKAAK